MAPSPRVARPSEIFAEQMRIQRERKALSQRELAARLAALGIGVHQTTIGKWEAGERRLLLDEALAISAALDVSPVHMISGSYLGAPAGAPRLAVAPMAVPVSPREMRMWIRGERPLLGQDEKRFFTEVAPEEWQAMQYAGVRELREDIQLLVAAWTDGDHGSVEHILTAMSDELERQRRTLMREVAKSSASLAVDPGRE